MLLRTHTAFSIFLIIIFIQNVQSKLAFSIMVIVATIIPDIDSSSSSYGRHMIFKPIQYFSRHRGVFHSLTCATIFSLLIAVFWPVLSLGFFIGYSGHLFLDSFTKDGIRPFWPLKADTSGPINSGGRIEESFFLLMIFVDILLFVLLFVLKA